MPRDAAPRALKLYRKLTRFPTGKWIFSRAVCLQAPYFASISPRFAELAPGRAVVTMKNRRRVRNHIGSVHAIAMCNLCELAAGLMTEVSMPAGMRWIPKSMKVEYLDKALTDLVAETSLPEPVTAGEAFELPVAVAVKDTGGQTVMRAVINMWISPRKPRSNKG